MTINWINLFLFFGASSGFMFILMDKLKIIRGLSLIYFCCIILILYYSMALFGLLHFSNFLFYCVGLYFLFKQRNNLKKNRVPSTKWLLAWSLPIFLVISALAHKFYFTYADELVSWGFNSKSIFLNKSLLDSDSIGVFENSFLHYPPGTQLFHFFIANQFGWSEPVVVITQLTLTCIVLSCAAIIISRKHAPELFICFTAVYYLFGFTLLSIFPDGLLGVFFLITIIVINYGTENEVKYLAPLLMFCLPLIKPSGLVLAIVCLGVQALGNKIAGNTNYTRSLLNLTVVIGSWTSWNIYLKLHDISSGIPRINLEYLLGDYFKNRVGISINSHVQNLISSLYGPDNPSGISLSNPAIVRVSQVSLAVIVILLFSIHFLLTFFNSSGKNAWYLPVALLFGFFVYQTFLQMIFLFYNSEYEGNNSAGLVRYTSTYLFAWACICFIEFFKLISSSQVLLTGLYICLCILLLTSGIPKEILTGQNNSSRAIERMHLDKLARSIHFQIADKNISIYVISQESWGFESLAFRLSNLPNRTNRNCWSIDVGDFESDKWSCKSDLSKLISDYDYLLILNGADKIVKHFPELFGEVDLSNQYQIFEITSQGNDLKLTEVDLAMILQGN